MPSSVNRRHMLATIGSFAAAPWLAPRAGRAGENWPIRQVRYVNGFPAGGATDTLSRVICQKMSELSGQYLRGREQGRRWRRAGRGFNR